MKNKINDFLRKYDIIIEIKENGIYFYHEPEIIKIDTKKKMEKINQEIFEMLQTPEEKQKIEKWNNQLIDSWNEIKRK